MKVYLFISSAIIAGVLDNILMRDLHWGGIWTYIVPANTLVFLGFWIVLRRKLLRTVLLFPAWSVIEDFACITILEPFPWFPREDWLPPLSTPLWWGIPLSYWVSLVLLVVYGLSKKPSKYSRPSEDTTSA